MNLLNQREQLLGVLFQVWSRNSSSKWTPENPANGSVMILPSLNSPSPLNTSTSYRVEKKPFPIPTLTNMTIYVRVSLIKLINSERHLNLGSNRFSNSVLRKCFVLRACLPTTEEHPSAGPSNPFHAQIAVVVPYACPCPV